MPKKKLNNRLEKLFEDIGQEPEVKQAKAPKGSGRKSSQIAAPDLSNPPAVEAPEPFSDPDLSTISDNELARNDVRITPSTLLSTAFRTDESNWATLKVVDESEQRTWGTEEQMLVKQVADQLSLALENARLFQETQLRAEEMAVLNDLARTLSSQLNVEQVLQETYFGVSQLIDARNFFVGIYNPERHEIEYPLNVTESSVDKEITIVPADKGISGYIFKTKKPLLIKSNLGGWLEEQNMDAVGEIAASWLGVPLMIGDDFLGVMAVQDYEHPEAYDEHARDILTAFASQAAIAIQNARLFQETQLRLNEQTILREAATAMSSAMELNVVLSQISKHMCTAVQATSTYVCNIELESGVFTSTVLADFISDEACEEEKASDLGSQYEEDEDVGFIEQLENEQFVISHIDEEDITNADREHMRKFGVQSILYVPLIIKTQIIGFVEVWESRQRREFTEEEISLCQDIARNAAIALENARLFDETNRRSEELASINEIISAASQTLETGAILETVMNKVLEITGFDGGLITMFNETRGKLERAIRIGMPGEAPEDPTQGLDGSLCEYVYQNGNDLIIQNLGVGTPKGANASSEVEAGLHGYIGIPIESKGYTLGTLCLFRYEDGPIQENIIELTRTIGGQLGFTLENARLFDESHKFRLGLERSADAVFMTDVEGTIVYANPSFETVYGFSPDEVIGENPRIIKSGVIPQEQYKHFWDTLLNKETVAGELVNKTKEGMLIPIEGTNSPILDEDGNILGFLAIHSDISQRKENEEALQRRNEYLAASSEIGRLVTSTLDLDTIFERSVNLILERFGYYYASIFTLDEGGLNAVLQEATGKAGQTLKERKHTLAVGSSSTVGKASASGETVVINDIAQDTLHKHNPLLPETKAETAIPLKTGDRVIGILDIQSTEVDAFSEDDLAILQLLADQISVGIDNARSYNIAQQAVEEMREVDRLKSQFLANMSHELRTPLNSIIGFARVILKGIDGPITDLQQQDLTAIFNSGQHLLGLINDILDLSRIEAGKMDLTFDEVNINDLISSVMSTAAGLVKDKPVELKSDIEADLPLVRADAMRIRQVLINFLSNAAKFTDEGEIVVKAFLEEFSKGQPPSVKISVIDTGPGISQEDQKKLFQAFSQVDASLTRKVGGSGLGLSICHHFIQMHNGQIGVNSSAGKGSTFYFTIPVVQSDLQVEESESEHVILAIDDDPQIINLYERYLQPKGFQVVGLSNPAKAKELAEELQPFAITLDIMMPGYDGWQVLTDLKSSSETRDIPVVVCSIVEDEEKGFSLGAADYLIKPVLEDDLLASLDRLNGDGSIREVLVIDDDPNDLRLLGKMISEQGRYKATLAEGGQAGWNAITSKAPHAVVLDLFMPELDGFTILENLRKDKGLRELPVIVITGADLTTEQRKQLDDMGQRLLQKSSLKEKDLVATLENVLQRVRVN